MKKKTTLAMALLARFRHRSKSTTDGCAELLVRPPHHASRQSRVVRRTSRRSGPTAKSPSRQATPPPIPTRNGNRSRSPLGNGNIGANILGSVEAGAFHLQREDTVARRTQHRTRSRLLLEREQAIGTHNEGHTESLRRRRLGQGGNAHEAELQQHSAIRGLQGRPVPLRQLHLQWAEFYIETG